MCQRTTSGVLRLKCIITPLINNQLLSLVYHLYHISLKRLRTYTALRDLWHLNLLIDIFYCCYYQSKLFQRYSNCNFWWIFRIQFHSNCHTVALPSSFQLKARCLFYDSSTTHSHPELRPCHSSECSRTACSLELLIKRSCWQHVSIRD